MKSGYKKLLIFESIILLVLILNSFVSSILSNYSMFIFLIAISIIFKFLFGFEKDRHRYIKDIIFEVVIFLLLYFLIYYLLGIFIGFAKNENYYSLQGFMTFILPIFLLVIIKEFLRYMILTKSEGSKLLIATTCIMFILIDVTSSIYYINFSSKYDIFTFIALTLLPAISTNIVCSYITIKAGYKPVIIYLLIISLYSYLLPIVPNPNAYLSSIINFLAPIILGYRIHIFFMKDCDDEITMRNYKKKRISYLIIPVLFTVFIVYITSGYFHYHAIAIASGSMSPEIKKGDVIVIEKLSEKREKLKVGQVIAYRYNNVIVVHRLSRIINIENKYYFYTKGDANSFEDNYVIEEEMIIGTVGIKVPFIGLPTVWLNEL